MSTQDLFDVSMEWEGIDELLKTIDLQDQNVAKAVSHAMVENVEDLLGQSMRIAPHDEGTMVGSASAKVNTTVVAQGNEDESISTVADPPQVHPGQVVIGEVSFNTRYAARQHEELDWQHKEGRQAKYLETPLKQRVTRYMKNIADAVRGALGK